MDDLEAKTIPGQSITLTGTQRLRPDKSSGLIDLKKEILKSKEKKEKEGKVSQNDIEDDDVFKTEEIKVEEIAIDGICGVY